MLNSDTVIEQLSTQLKTDPILAILLPSSLLLAKRNAEQYLTPKCKPLFDALSWPTNNEAYLAYLTEFSRLVPQENINPEVDAWNNCQVPQGDLMAEERSYYVRIGGR